MTEQERARRAGLNEALFREINERLAALSQDATVQQGSLDLVCECHSRECADRLTLSLDEYAKVRADSLNFVVLPHHEDPRVEDIVERQAGWLIVRKRPGEPAAVASAEAYETDPARR